MRCAFAFARFFVVSEPASANLDAYFRFFIGNLAFADASSVRTRCVVRPFYVNRAGCAASPLIGVPRVWFEFARVIFFWLLRGDLTGD
jgi:hypothetical protein